MAALTDHAKHEIVTLLARFTSPADVVAHVREHFGIEINRFQVRGYDPTNPRFEAGAKWRVIFEAARRAYLSEVGAIPIGNQAFRLNELQKLYMRARDSGNLVLAMSLLEQAAKESGGALTNQRNVALEPTRSPYADMTLEERRARVAEMLRDVIQRARADQEEPPSTQLGIAA